MFLEGLGRALPGVLSQGLYLMIHEALINAARHAGASSMCVALSVQDTSVHLMVRDNGRGFPFHGHYDLAALTALSLGPRMLRERVASLGGVSPSIRPPPGPVCLLRCRLDGLEHRNANSPRSG
jgi:signal transduction histidine kinase